MKKCGLFILPLLLLLAACHTDRCKVPFGEGGDIDLLQPDFINLYNNPGETLIINRGYKGILVHCTNLSEYVAFDCVCPSCLGVRTEPDDPRRASILTCPECGSRFEVFFGNPLDGATTSCGLYQYRTFFDGRILSIF